MPRPKKRIASVAAQDSDNSQDIMSAVGGESEEDLVQLNAGLIRETVVFATDWTTDTIINQLRKGNISLDPSFQRRERGLPKEKVNLLSQSSWDFQYHSSF